MLHLQHTKFPAGLETLSLVTATQTVAMANKMKLDTPLHGSSRLGAMAAICLPLCVDLNVDVGVDVDGLCVAKVRQLSHPMPESAR